MTKLNFFSIIGMLEFESYHLKLIMTYLLNFMWYNTKLVFQMRVAQSDAHPWLSDHISTLAFSNTTSLLLGEVRPLPLNMSMRPLLFFLSQGKEWIRLWSYNSLNTQSKKICILIEWKNDLKHLPHWWHSENAMVISLTLNFSLILNDTLSQQ